jgi:hypothetical protein
MEGQPFVLGITAFETIREARERGLRYVSVLLLLVATAAGVIPGEQSDPDVRRLERIIQEFQGRLEISARVLPSVVEEDDYLVSVRRSPTARDTFIIQFEKGFLAALSEGDLRAVIAHEMGHIWIFTHHPYLQTEALANQKAIAVVSRESLARVYEKVWRRGGQKGSLEDFLAKVDQK